MGLPNVMNTGRSGMVAAKAAIATTGHNIANANVEGYSRQRVQQTTDVPRAIGPKAFIGTGTLISRVDRLNDPYIEKQIRNATRDLANLEEKDIALKQTEDIFNEMGGDGLNRLISRFFNEFRKLENEPSSEAVRQSVREASQSMINDFHRIRKELEGVRTHIDSRLEGHVAEINALTEEVKDLNIKIKTQEVGGASPNDLLDQRDQALKKLASYMDLSMHTDTDGGYIVDIRGVGPLITGGAAEKFSVHRSPADERGKPEGAYDIKSTASALAVVTHQLQGGKLGGLLEVRDQTLSQVMERLDDLASTIVDSVNEIHQQGFTRNGAQGVSFFKPIEINQASSAANFIELSDSIQSSVNNIAAAAAPSSPGDNRIAIAISRLQYQPLLEGGRATVDDYYNSIVSNVGVASARTRSALTQQKDIHTQLNKMRDQIAGVSIDEETANLLQFQHVFDASAKVIQVADEMLKTVLDIKRG